MSTNLINNEEDSIESFNNPGYYGNISSKLTSKSALNKDNKNIHNSIYSSLVPGVNKIIVKENQKFTGKLNKINPYFYNEKPGNAGACKRECEKVKQCAGYEYDLNSGECNLYNTVPNNFEDDPYTTLGYKIDYKYDISNLDDEQKQNILRRMGSQYLQNYFNLKNTDSTKDVNKCIETIMSAIRVRCRIEFIVGCGRDHESNRLLKFYLTYKGNRVSNIIYSNGLNYPRCGFRWWELNFYLKNTKADGIFIEVGNNGIQLKKMEFYMRFQEFSQKLFTINTNRWVKNTKYIARFPKLFNTEEISFQSNVLKAYQGINKAETKKYDKSKTDELDEILSKENWSLKIKFEINVNHKNWRNLFSYGNSNYERAPALWIYPNNPWRLHFRIRTNASWNDGFDFNIPRSLRKYNQKMTLVMDYIKYKDERYSDYPGFIMNATINGIYVGSRVFSGLTFKTLKNRTFYIKDPWHAKSGYKVYDVSFSTVPLVLASTGYRRGFLENSNRFNAVVSNLQAPYYLIRIGYSGYYSDYFYVVYKRKTSSKGVDMYSLLHTDWFNENMGIKNKHRVDFDLYSTLDDAMNNRNPWKYCNFNDSGIGFPRDCGRNKWRPWQWQSKTRGGKVTWMWFLYKAENDYVNINMDGNLTRKLKSYYADPKCVYKNLSDPKRIYTRKLDALSDKDIGKNLGIELDDDKINANIQQFNETITDLENVQSDMDNTNVSSSIERNYLSDVRKLKSKNKNNEVDDINYQSLKEADGSNEKFENKNSCTSMNNFYKILIAVIILMIIFYLFLK